MGKAEQPTLCQSVPWPIVQTSSHAGTRAYSSLPVVLVADEVIVSIPLTNVTSVPKYAFQVLSDAKVSSSATPTVAEDSAHSLWHLQCADWSVPPQLVRSTTESSGRLQS